MSIRSRVLRGGLAAGLVACGLALFPVASVLPQPRGGSGGWVTLSESERSVAREFLQLWSNRADGILTNRFLGVRAKQNPMDVWITQEILWEVRPDFVVETGTFHGGSALLWSTLLEHINPDARIVTIDIEDQRDERAKHGPLVERVDFLLGSSSDPDIVAQVKSRVAGGRVLVILDSLHTAEHVAAELEAYAPLVSPGSYLIVQDTLAGPLPAIGEFLASHPEFTADRERERLLISNNLSGFLKRNEKVEVIPSRAP